MNRKYWDKIMMYNGVPKNSKIVYYKNPNECNRYRFERVNPNHVGIIWGKRKNKSKNWIKIGKVVMGSFAILCYGIIDILYSVLIHIDKTITIFWFVFYIVFSVFFWFLMTHTPGGVPCSEPYSS